MPAYYKCLLLLLLLPCSLFAQKDTNKVNSKGNKQGLWIQRYPNGKIKTETWYANGEKSGLEKTYRDDGKPLSEITYAGIVKQKKSSKPRSIFLAPEPPVYKKAGREKWYYYDTDGNLTEISYLKDGLKDSTSTLYYPTGEVKAIGTFREGRAEGMIKSFYKDGTSQSDCHYKNGRKDSVQVYYYPNGEISYIGLMLNGKREGTHVYKHENGKIWQEIIFRNDLPWTVLTNYDPDGKAVPMGTLKDGNGTLYIYEENGKLKAVEEYKKGLKVQK